MAIDVAALNALTRQFGSDRATLDEEENRSRTNYRNVLDQMKDASTKGFAGLNQNMSDQGLLHSGVGLQENAKLANQFNTAGQQAGNAQALDLSSIARRRLEAEAEFNAQKGLMVL